MSNFAEYNIEAMVITILAAQSSLPAAVHRDVDDGADKDRIVVKCDPREVELAAKRPGDAPIRWKASLTVEMRLASIADTATLQTWSTAIDAAFAGSVPAATTTLFNSLYGSSQGYFEITASDGGSRQSPGSQVREWSRTFTVITS
jgi:hypothetical protein